MVHPANHNWQKIQSKNSTPNEKKPKQTPVESPKTQTTETVLIAERLLNSTELNDLLKCEEALRTV